MVMGCTVAQTIIHGSKNVQGHVEQVMRFHGDISVSGGGVDSKVQVIACFIQFYSGLCGQVHSDLLGLSDDDVRVHLTSCSRTSES